MDKTFVTQISRFDRWKDPLGMVKTFRLIRRNYDCRLVLLGNLAPDDPEGEVIFKAVQREASQDPDILLRLDVPQNDLTVNELQRAAVVVVQKSLREGFALTVSEELWKGTPVVGTK